MIWLIAINIPIFGYHYLLIILGVEEDAITPWRGTLGIIDLLFLYVFIGGEEVDCALFVHGKNAGFVGEVVLVFLEEGLEVSLDVGFCELLLGVHLLDCVEDLADMLVLGLEAKVHIANEESELTLIE